MSTRLQRRVVPKAASYTIVPMMDAPGTTFTNKGATGPITFTLPAATRAVLGFYYRFKVVVDQSVLVASAVADTLLALNDLAADSVAASTAGQKLGAIMEAECVETADGTFQWAVSGVSVGHAFTVAT
jgi:hypothetical protein